MLSRRLLVTLLVLVFVLAPFSGPFANIATNQGVESSVLDHADAESDLQMTDGRSIIAADPIIGVLDPVVVEQYGYSGTGQLDASTDSRHNNQSAIPIDNTTGWVGSQAEVEIWDMKRLYVENGTLDDGIDGTTFYPNTATGYPYGWDFDWDDPSYGGAPGEQNVSTAYDKDSGYIVLQTEGQLDTSSGFVEYRHYDGTYIYWNQTINNIPDSDNLTLSFMYNYDSGVIDDYVVLEGWVWLDVWIDGINVDSIDLLTECPSRNTWFEFVVANIIDAPTTFNLEIGIYIEAFSTYYLTNPGGDYDDDGVLDFDLTRVNRVLLDNISLLSVDQPSYEAVDLTFNAGLFSSAITELSNYGTAVISNPGYWSDSSLAVGISANVSISCDYEVKLLSHNYGNSLWESQPTKEGVAYIVDAGVSASLSTFTYIGSEGVAIYENFSVELYLPHDWENATVFDPFLNDVTGQCTFLPGSLEIPTSILDRLGWWQLTLESPNYAESVNAQIYDTGWSDNTLFRPSNVTRVSVTLGTISETPIIVDPVNVTWFSPDDSIWSQDSRSTGTGGVVNTSQRTLGGLNTTAGEWSIVAAWTNGTEVAYGLTSFDMYHTASLAVPVEYATIQTDVGLIISNFVYYADADTSDYLLDDSITITANWTGSTVPFTQDLVKNWWRGEFDTSSMEGGQYTVVVTASRPYFDDVTTQFTVIATQQTTLEILNAGAIPIDRGLNEIFTVQMDYELLNGTGVTGAVIDVDYSGPGAGLSWYNFNDNNNGHYSVDIICDISATYGITITLNKTYYHGASDSFTLVIGETGTELELVNGTSDVVLYGDSYRLVVEYRNSTGYGLPGADLDIVSVTPGVGLLYTGFTPIIDGFYEITFTPSATGTFSIVISADIFNHETQYTTFTLTGVVIPTILSSNPSSTTVSVNQSFTVQLLFQDESLNPIDVANITAIDPPSGILISEETSIGGGLYNITLQSSEIDVYNLLFRATADNYQSSIVGFTISVTAIPTTLEILNAGSIPVENGLNEIFTVQLSYELLNGSGVTGALPTMIFTGPQEGLAWTNFIDNNNGLYTLDIACNVSAVYGITITLSKLYHYNTSDTFTLIIGETGSDLQLLNGTADVVLYGDSYILIVEYRNSTGTGLDGANLQVVTITPATGLMHSGFSPIVDGYYQITLNATAAGAYSIVISASFINHETQYATFTLTATGIPTILTSLPSSASIALDHNFTVQLILQDESLNPIDSANFTITNPPGNLIISDVVPIGAGTGLYNFTLTPLATGTYNVLFRSSADNYQSSSAAFTLIVTEIETRIEFDDDVSSALVEFAEPYFLTVYYIRVDDATHVAGANVSVIVQDSGLVITVDEFAGYYLVTIKGLATYTWSLTITANKTDHFTSTKQFQFEVEEIDTSIEGSSPLEALFVGRSYPFIFNYLFDSNSSYIFGADVVSTGDGADWVNITALVNGQYAVNLTPTELGEHYVVLTFERVGFESASYRIVFIVESVPISVEILEGTNGLELVTTTLRVSVTETDTGNPVSDATVFYRIIESVTGIPEDPVSMTESDIPGIYVASLTLPDADDIYLVQVSCEAENFELDEPLSMELGVTRSFTSVLMLYSVRYWWTIFGVAAVVGAMGYRRSARKSRVRQNKITLAIKRRFDDVRSLMGVIVLHKDSGLPVYSKILREGLEETVISAFITAITSFRGEFDIESASEEWGLIPISDIVRVISTNKLVCAFITTGNPSAEQRERMIRFAKTVAFIFDDTMEDVPIVILDHHTTLQFNSLFEDILDGALLRTYTLDDAKKYPTSTCADERIAKKQGEEFKLEDLASEIAACGLEEGRVYQAIMRALESEFLVTTEESPFATELLRAPESVEDEG